MASDTDLRSRFAASCAAHRFLPSLGTSIILPYVEADVNGYYVLFRIFLTAYSQTFPSRYR